MKCPAGFISYNKFMKGVDRGNQRRMAYLCRTKCRKLYKYPFWFLVDVAVTNSRILFAEAKNKTVTTKDFRILLAEELIGDYCSKKEPGRRTAHHPKPLPLLHYPRRILHDNRAKRYRCGHCQEQAVRKDTSWLCVECNKWLCMTGDGSDCYYKWHEALLHKD